MLKLNFFPAGHPAVRVTWIGGIVRDMKLSGKRLDLQPLTALELSASVGRYTAAALEQSLGLKLAASILDEEMLYAMKVRYSKVLQNEDNYLWFTCWAVIHRAEQQVIGFLILKGQPNERGEVIIGYIIDEDHWGQGYATEAVGCVNEWIFSHPEACWVIADTEPDNFASHKVLKHLGAEQYRETEELLWWRIARPQTQK
ncbi:GNAT family N-acetyltransferase [Paenibacillus tianjinensis]|uniref:GNAT family N-acetyltransferase n=1 Tax=Paenibacillus tianjinensis TaxID=2810347 RepID=A0ABX7L7W3_9BACL|nr:GNAT family N-acetyltransferase [Paenibacillus tianjinensis]QSF44244.1 GNAT family N-acetyltransferase [Paenibacillus tianjinensis]